MHTRVVLILLFCISHYAGAQTWQYYKSKFRLCSNVRYEKNLTKKEFLIKADDYLIDKDFCNGFASYYFYFESNNCDFDVLAQIGYKHISTPSKEFKNREYGELLLDSAYKNESCLAAYYMSLINTNDYDKSVKYLISSDSLGCDIATYALYRLEQHSEFFGGRSKFVSKSDSVYYLRKAAANDFADAKYELALYLYKHFWPTEKVIIRKLLKSAYYSALQSALTSDLNVADHINKLHEKLFNCPLK